MNAAEKYDVLVLGGGTAGKLVAWTMAKEGRRTAVVERKYIGGSCPNIACLPSKNVIHSAKVASLVGRHREFGIETGPISIDMAGVYARKREMVDGIVQVHLDKYHAALDLHRGDELIFGDATFVAPRTVHVVVARWGRTYPHCGAGVREPRKPRDDTRHARFAGSQAADPYRGAGLAAAPRPFDRPRRRLRRPGTKPGSAQAGKPRHTDLPRHPTCRKRRCRRFAGDICSCSETKAST